MDIDSLVSEGEKIKDSALSSDYTIPCYVGVEYKEWVAKGILYLESKYPNKTITKRFIDVSNKNDVSSFETMLGCIKALKEYEDEEKKKNIKNAVLKSLSKQKSN